MTTFQVLGVLLTVSATFAYVNHRWLKLPTAIGLMAIALAASLVMIAADRLGVVRLASTASHILEHIDFNETLLHGMLGALLFAGALHIDLRDIRDELATITVLAVFGTVASSLLIGTLFFALASTLHLPIDFVSAVLFGALISPTDPVAVLGVLKDARVPKRLETQIAGESLLNDGVGVVIFVTVLGIAKSGAAPTASGIIVLFLREAVGGGLFGLAAGYVSYRLLRSIDHYQTELLITIALVVGGYACAEALHLSAPIAAVIAGLVIGNSGRSLGMSDVTREHLDTFWMLIDEILNAVLFVLVGFELIVIPLSTLALTLGALAIMIVLFARVVTVGLPVRLLSRKRPPIPGQIAILSWGGLRGGISVALALSLPESRGRSLIVASTYVVVVFSVLVQGLTLGKLARRLSPPESEDPAHE